MVVVRFLALCNPESPGVPSDHQVIVFLCLEVVMPPSIESSQTIFIDAFKLPLVKKKNKSKRRKECKGTSSSEEENKIAKIVTRRRETTEELEAGDINENNEGTNIEKLASAVSIHVCNNTTNNSGQKLGPPSKRDQFLKWY
ncbi:hypothetical protein HHI36_022627 [Cryptolaemus montrouzieri]|uniref:Uncharacterized protein n=1 Tax=Cryptolaemus montrouzieri TaxID=559131 RepID=A0ABD2N0B1_9CUCU